MAAKSRSGKKSKVSHDIVDAADKDRQIAELTHRIAALENELQLKQSGTPVPDTAEHDGYESLKESERLYRTLFDNADYAFELVEPIRDGEGRVHDFLFVKVNETYGRQTGLNASDIVGKRVEDILPGMEPYWYEAIDRVDRTGVPETIENYHEGTGRWYEDYIFKFKEGRVGILFRNITESRRAEEALAAAHRHLQSIIDNTPDLVYAFDLEERFVLANAALAGLLDSTPEWMIGKRRHEFMPREDADWHETNDRQAIEAGRALEFEEHSQLKGRSITWLTKKFPLRDTRGRIYAVAGISADISERKRAEEALQKSEARRKVAEAVEGERRRLLDVLETMPVMVCLITPAYHIPWGNRTFREKFGESQGLHCYEFCYGKSEPCDFCQAFTPLKTGQPNHFELQNPDGTVSDVYDYPFTDVDGSPMVLEMAMDITERKRTEAELEKYRRHLEDLIQNRTRDLEDAKQQAELYLDLMGHDISNMHQIILGQLQLAEEIVDAEGKLSGEDKELIDTSIRNLLRSAKLIDNVKNLQRLQTGEFSLTPMELDEVLNDAVAAYSGIPDKQVTIEYTPANDHVIMVNPIIKEVFNNLLDNAVKHSGDPVKVGIAVRSTERNGKQYHMVSIEDNGPGIPDEKKEEVFHRLKRGQTKARGTGLGLYLVKTLVENFDGFVELEDRVKGNYTHGCRFLVYLPTVEGGHNDK